MELIEYLFLLKMFILQLRTTYIKVMIILDFVVRISEGLGQLNLWQLTIRILELYIYLKSLNCIVFVRISEGLRQLNLWRGLIKWGKLLQPFPGSWIPSLSVDGTMTHFLPKRSPWRYGLWLVTYVSVLWPVGISTGVSKYSRYFCSLLQVIDLTDDLFCSQYVLGRVLVNNWCIWDKCIKIQKLLCLFKYWGWNQVRCIWQTYFRKKGTGSHSMWGTNICMSSFQRL